MSQAGALQSAGSVRHPPGVGGGAGLTPPRASIEVMSPLLANQIAAGEVVDRPASVVKELVENSLDAGAGRVVVELEQGGIELVRVADDGHGIPERELTLALTPHATSKVRAVEDLDRIATMGFRGEALAAIASVSRLVLRSRTAEQPAAAELVAEGTSFSSPRPASGPVGTLLSVANLFFNTPARRKFLRTPATEQGRCIDAVRSLAMAHPAVAFRVAADGRTVLDVPAGQSPRERALALLGRELEPELLEASLDALDGPLGAGGRGGPGVTLWGLVGRPGIARATGSHQFVFVNGRSVRDKVLQHALREAYRGLIEPGRFPTAVLMIEMDPAAVDVNVHPAKSEVRFRDSSLVHGAVTRAVREALRAADLTPAVEGPAGRGLGGGWLGAGSVPGSAAELGHGGDQVPAGGGDWPRGPQYGAPRAGSLPASAGGGAPAGSGSAGPGARSIDAGLLASVLRRAPTYPSPFSAEAYREQSAPAGDGQGRVGAGGASGAPASAAAPLPASAGEPLAGAAELPPALNPALQVFNSFLITQDEQGVLIIDQHALHERVMFEKLLARVASGPLESQRLLVPSVVGVSPAQLEALEAARPLMARLGIEAEQNGPASVAVHAFTTLLFERGVEPAEFVPELLDKAGAAAEAGERLDAGAGTGPTESALHEVLDMMACKAAIKAGDRLSDLELAELLALRESVERSSNCPHGRPTSIRVSVSELYKRFGRT